MYQVRSNGSWRLARTIGKKDEVIEEGVIERPEVEKIMAKKAEAVGNVSVQMGLTLSLGNYEFARVDVGVTEPCVTSERDAAFTSAREFATQKLNEEMIKIRDHVKKGRAAQ